MERELFKKTYSKLAKFCAYQERCTKEVLDKLQSLSVPKSEHLKMVRQLEEDQYLNEERYAQLFVRGKHLHNHWGKLKIRSALKQKNIPEALIAKAMEEIDDDRYYESIARLIRKKMVQTSFLKKIKDQKGMEAKKIILFYLFQKGYEVDISQSVLKKFIQ